MGESGKKAAEVTSIAIIGGGLAGLAAAVNLVSAGHRVCVYEATKKGGGRTRSFEDSAFGRELDNGQHLMMGCYRETLAFLQAIHARPEQTIFFQRNLAVDMVREGGRKVSLRCPALPAPLHLATGLLRMRGVGPLHKAAALRAGLMFRNEVKRPDDNETCDAWLRRLGQTATIRSVFWEPLIWAVLNDDPLVSSAAMLMAVIERAFLGTRDGSRLGMPILPLSRLYVDRAIDFIRSHGGEVMLGQPVRKLCISNHRVTGFTLKSGETVNATKVITAVPPHALLDLLPEALHSHPVFHDIGRLKTAPIVNIWAQLDRSPFPDRPFVGLVHSPLHWLFDRSQIEGQHAGDVLLNATISGARAFIEDSATSLQQLLVDELKRFFPERPVAVKRVRVIKEKRATISHAAGTYHWRPKARSPVAGLFLAGDWVRTGLPATIESATQSGHEAAALARDEN